MLCVGSTSFVPCKTLDSKIADINIADINKRVGTAAAGAITAAPYLQEFVEPYIPWRISM